MKKILKIVNSLSEKEIDFIRKYFNEDSKNKKLLLFNGLLNNSYIDDTDASFKLFNKKGSAYSQLKLRLKKDLYRFLLFFENDNDISSNLVKAEYKFNNLYSQAKALQKRKLYLESSSLVYEAYNICKKYDLIYKKTLLLMSFGHLIGSIEGYKKFEKFNIDIEEDISIVSDLLLSNYLRTKFILSSKNRKTQNKDYVLNLEYIYLRVQNLALRNNNKKLFDNYYFVAIEYFILIKDFNKVFDYSMKYKNLILNNIEVKTKLREVISYLHLTIAYLNLNKFHEATFSALKAYDVIKKHNSKNTRNELEILKYIFLSNLREESNKDLKAHLERGLAHKQVKTSIKKKEEWQFYKAAYFFKMKEFDKVLNAINSINVLLKEGDNWNFTFRLFEIMCYIEQDSFDMVNFRIETFRKFLSSKKNTDFNRIITIHKILKSLLKSGFNFNLTAKKEKENLKSLESGINKYYWDPLGYEIIRFEKWFYTKVK